MRVPVRVPVHGPAGSVRVGNGRHGRWSAGSVGWMNVVCVDEVSGMLLHEAERPATWGMYLCDCVGCRLALQATGLEFPETCVCIRFACGTRRVLHWSEYCYAHEAYRSGADPEAFLRFSDEFVNQAGAEHIRDVFVVRGTAAPHCSCFEREDTSCRRTCQPRA